MWIILLYIVVGVGILGLFTLFKEIISSEEVDNKNPFIYGDYDPKKDPTLKHVNLFCKHCEWFDGDSACLLKQNLGKITDDVVKNCKLNSFFKAM